MRDLSGDMAIAADVLDRASVPVGLLSAGGVVVGCNSSFARACGRPSGELLGAVLADSVVADDRVGFHSCIAAVVEGSDPDAAHPPDAGDAPEVEVRFVGADGRVRPARLNLGLLTGDFARAVDDSDGDPRHGIIMCVATDRSEERRAERASRRARVEEATTSMTDPATGLLNERGIELTLESAARRAGRHDSAFALIHCRLGTGDAPHDATLTEPLVAACVDRIRQRLRPSDTIARAGDAIVVVAEDLADEQDALGVGYRVMSTVVEPVPTDQGPVGLVMHAAAAVADGSVPVHKLTPAAVEAAKRQDDPGGIALVDMRRTQA